MKIPSLFSACFAAALVLSGCPRPLVPTTPKGSAPPVLPPLPAWAAVEPTSDERLEDALQVFEALPLGSPEAAALRDRLVAHLTGGFSAALARGEGQEGIKRLGHLLTLYRRDVPRDDSTLDGPAYAPLSRAALEVFRIFSRRGAAKEALTALAVLETVDSTARERWRGEIDQLLTWLGELEEPLFGTVPPYHDVSEALLGVFARWPSVFLRGRLSLLLARQYAALRPLPAMEDLPKERPYRLALEAVHSFPWQRLRLLLLEDNRALVERYVESLRSVPDADQRLLTLITQALAPQAGPGPWIVLAEAYATRWPELARELCGRARKEHPGDPNVHYCLGTLALQREKPLLALRHFGDALRANPEHRQAWERFSSAYLDRLAALLSQERLDQVEREVGFLEAFHREALRRWPGTPLATSLADVYFILARGYFNEGRIREALATLQKARRLKPTPQIQMQLAEIHYYRGEVRQAIARFKDVYEGLNEGSAWRAYWELRIAPMMARSHEMLAERLEKDSRLATDTSNREELARSAAAARTDVTQVRARALHIGKLLLTSFKNANLRAEVLYYVGWIFWEAGQHRLGIQSFNAALDEAPNRSSTYVDVISFLVMRGHFEEALDAYHRALARTEVSDYLKAYCTFWILDLGTRAKVDPERLGLAEVYIRYLKGSQWYHRLAAFVRGQVSYKALVSEATSKGQRAEADFYQSMALLRGGKVAEARALWQRIVDSEMMAFFEYRMVRSYLAHGAPDAPVTPAK